MRIIAGVARGRRLVGPRGGATRPFPDRMKEALFSSLGNVVEDAVVLDLYAGTGSLGLEALSRGAGAVTFVERDRAALAVLRENIARVGLGGTIIAAEVGWFLAHPGDGYHLAFVDPPYDQPLASVARILEGLEPAVTDGGVVVVHRRRGEEPPLPGSLVLTDRRRYGQAEIWRLAARRQGDPS